MLAPVGGRPKGDLPVAVTRGLLLVAFVALLLCAAPVSAQLSRIPEPPTRGAGLPKDVPGALRKAVDYIQSSLLLTFTDPGDCEVGVYRGELLEAKLPPLGDDRDRYLHRVFDIPADGVDLSLRFSRPGYRERTETVHIARRQVKTLGVMLSTEYEADRLLFECPGRGGTAIAAVLPDGSGAEVLCDTDEPDSEPCVAPDGLRVAFASGRPGRRRLVVLDRDTGTLEVLPTGTGDDHLPRWLTNDSLVFQREADPSRVMLMEAGAQPAALFVAGGADADAFPGPDGDTVYFATTRFGAGWDLAAGKLSDGSVIRLTSGPGDERCPVPKPAGDELAYIETANGTVGALARPIGKGPDSPPQVIGGPATSLAFSGDGRIAAFRDADGIRLWARGASWSTRIGGAAPGGGQVAWGRFARLSRESALAALDLPYGHALLELDRAHAPDTVRRFLDLCNRGFYDNTAVHRVERGMVVQLGCPLGNGTGGDGPATPRERTGLPLARGAVAMEPDDGGQASSRFLACLSDLPPIDGCGGAFGRVVRGLDLLDWMLPGDPVRSVRWLRFDEDELRGPS